MVRDGQLLLPSISGGFELVIPVDQLSDPGAAELVAAELSGGWEFEERAWLRATLGPRHTFVDVGAHFGLFALEAAMTGAGLVAIEPHPDNLAVMTRAIRHNRVADRVRVVAAAATESAGPVWLRTNTSMGHRVSGRAPDAGGHDQVWPQGPLAGRRVWQPAEGVPLAQILADVDGPLVVKLDLEGGELAALRGAEALLAAGRISHVVWEQGEGQKRNTDHGPITAFLTGFGLRTRDLTPLTAVSELETA
jgi:FkbM family methyltransferase